MTTETQHIIKAQQFQILLDKEEEAHQVQSEISVLQESRINKLLDTVLSKYSNENNIYQFDRIELDLGVITKANYENELVYRLEEELTKYFTASIRENGTLRNGKMIVLHDRKLEQFEHFILNGHLNWDSTLSQTPSKLLKELIVQNTTGLKDLLIEHGKKEAVRKRLIFQFNEESLESIVSLVAKTESTYIIAYKKNMLEHQRKQHLVDTEYSTFRNAVWEVILAYLFVESNSYYNKKNFLQYFIRKIAEKYNLAYSVLLEAIARGVATEQKNTQIEFKKLIIELKTDHRQQQKAQQKQASIQPITITQWIKHVDNYLKVGTFNSTFSYTSKELFNQQFERMLPENHQVLFSALTKWLNHFSKRERLLLLLNDKVLNQILLKLSLPFIKENITFFGMIQKSNLSSVSRALWNEIEEKKARIILGSYIGNASSLKDILSSVLKQLKYELTIKESLLFHCLKEIEQQLPIKYREVVKKFLSTFSNSHYGKIHPAIDEKLLNEITQSINDYTHTNEAELWQYWINQQVQKWMIITGLNKQALVNQLKDRLIKQLAQPSVISLIEKLAEKKSEFFSGESNGFENNMLLNGKHEQQQLVSTVILTLLEKDIKKILDQKKLFSEWSIEVVGVFQQLSRKYNFSLQFLFETFITYLENDIHKNQLKKELIYLQSSKVYTTLTNQLVKKENEHYQQDKVHYVLTKGNLPWWTDGYTWVDFNTDFAQLLRSPKERKRLMAILPKKASKLSLTKVLSRDNLHQFWQVFDTSSDKIYANLMLEIEQLFYQQMLPIGSITNQQYLEFTDQFFKILQQQPTKEKIQQLLFQFIKKSIASSSKESKSLQLLIIDLVQQIMQKTTDTALKNELKKWLTERYKEMGNAPINLSSASIQDFLSTHSLAGQWEGYSLLDQLEKIKQTAHSEWEQLMHQKELRENLIEELGDNDFLIWIQQNLNVNQQRFLKESMAVLEGSSSFITSREFSMLKKQYFQLLVLKLSVGGFSSWGLENWSRLLLQCMENVLGESKSKEVVLKINGKLLAIENDDYKKGIIVLDQIHRLIDHTDQQQVLEPIKQEEEKDYRKLGEETPREFLDPIFIKNAGLIILAPYLGMLFEKCGLMLQGEFIDDASQFKAVHLLEYAASGKTGKEEHELVINKLLCGMIITDSVERNVELTDKDKETVNGLLAAITQRWKPLNGTSVEGLQVSFLQREGKLEEEAEQYFLKIEQKAFDMLLDQISWNISRIKLSWMEKILIIEWR